MRRAYRVKIKLEKYTGCISCFGCKKEKFKGRCICRDGLTPVLDAIREADGLIIGPTEFLVSGETLQLKDYSKTDWPWTMFDPQARQQRHETVFPEECKRAYEMGAALVR